MLKRILVLILGGYAMLALYLYLGQSGLVYVPDLGGREIRSSPSDIGLAFEEVWFPTDDGERLNAWLVRAPESRGTLLFCHGNAGNIAGRLDSIRIFTDLGLDVFIFDYRGYGLSSGQPSEQGTYRDAVAAWRWLTRERGIGAGRIVLFGRSLGAAVAVELATRVPAVGLIAESGFTSVPDRGSELYPYLPVRFLSRFQYDNLAKIGAVNMPLLVIHSPQDAIIPYHHGLALYAAASEPKYFLEIWGGHNDGFRVSGEAYRQGLEIFLERLDW